MHPRSAALPAAPAETGTPPGNTHRIAIELVPRPCWGVNLRAVLPEREWDNLRRACYAAALHRCEVCFARGELHAHECWFWDIEARTQTLVAIQVLCSWCHRSVHLGFSEMQAREGKLDLGRVIEHYCRVNQCSRETFECDYYRAKELAADRSRHEWAISWGSWSDLVERARRGEGEGAQL
jgi:hypothetical protein